MLSELEQGTSQLSLQGKESIQKNFHKLKALDCVLFLGKDPVAKLIKNVTLDSVVPQLTTPFNALWTHAGILVDKSILPLPFLDDGKLYLYESIFSGTVLGYTYSKVVAIDYDVKRGGCRLGPQIRDFEAVVDEVDSEVAVCCLNNSERERLENLIKARPSTFLDLYNQYYSYSYPLMPMRQFEAASDTIYNQMRSVRSTMEQNFPNLKGKEENAVFCSQLVAILYKALGVPSFMKADPVKYTPLELEVAPEFKGRCYFVKEHNEKLLKDGCLVPTIDRTTYLQTLIEKTVHHESWQKVPSSGNIPSNAIICGEDINGTPLYAVRVKIGRTLVPGKIGRGWDKPNITLLGKEVGIGYEYEILVSTNNMEWIEAQNGHVPSSAVPSGIEDDGSLYYLARAELKTKEGVLGNFGIGKKVKSFQPGKLLKSEQGARIPFAGKEHITPKYEVLCFTKK